MDVVLVGFIAAFAAGGWRTGLLRRVAGLGFMALAFVLGAYIRQPVGGIITSIFKDIPADYAELVGYTVAFPLILGAAHVIAHPFLKDRAVSGLTHELDQVAGALFGALEAILIASAAVVILDTYFGTAPTIIGQTPGLAAFTQFRDAFNASTTVHLLRDTTVPLVLTILGPLLPKDISTLLPSGLPRGLPIPTS
jgi:uncharacterized membrane protein required for colicin V production